MARFLIASIFQKDSPELPHSHQVFKVSEDCSPYDVVLPSNTLYFVFVTAHVESAKEVIESFVTIRLGDMFTTTSSLDLTYENEGKRYFIGKKVTLGDTECIFNECIQAIIPITCLGDNYEIIDL